MNSTTRDRDIFGDLGENGDPDAGWARELTARHGDARGMLPRQGALNRGLPFDFYAPINGIPCSSRSARRAEHRLRHCAAKKAPSTRLWSAGAGLRADAVTLDGRCKRAGSLDLSRMKTDRFTQPWRGQSAGCSRTIAALHPDLRRLNAGRGSVRNGSNAMTPRSQGHAVDWVEQTPLRDAELRAADYGIAGLPHAVRGGPGFRSPIASRRRIE
jgi:hypothetical protein